MSKYISKKFIIFFGLVVVIPTVLILILNLIGNYRDTQDKDRIQSSYKKIQMPSSFSIVNSLWTSGSLDVSANWTYKYKSKNNLEYSSKELRKSLINAGFVVRSDCDTRDNYYREKCSDPIHYQVPEFADNEKDRVTLTIYFRTAISDITKLPDESLPQNVEIIAGETVK